MSGKKLTLTLTQDQQNQIKQATGKNIAELSIDLAAQGHLTENEIHQVTGGVSLNYQKIEQ